MQTLLETVLHLDANDDLPGLLAFVQQEARDPDKLLAILPPLLTGIRLRPAFIVAMLLANAHHLTPLIALTLSLGGLRYDNPQEEQRGMASLGAQMDALPEAQHVELYHRIIAPLMAHLLTPSLQNTPEVDRGRLLEMVKAAVPPFRTLFDASGPIPVFSREAMRQRHPAHTHHQEHPPPATPSQPYRVLVAMRETFAPNAPSYLLACGPRITSAMNAYGWQALFHGIQATDPMDTCRAIANACRDHEATLVLLDDTLLLRSRQVRAEMIAQLRREQPALKVVGCFVQTQELTPALLTEAPRLLDLLWMTDAPPPCLRGDPKIARKILHRPFPMAEMTPPPPARVTHLHCAGQGDHDDWLHACWLTAARPLSLPIQRDPTPPREETPGPPPATHNPPAHSLADARCCLDFTRRPDLSYHTTSHGFEVLWQGALLVQEWSPDRPPHAIPGEHYMTFATLAELASVARFITENPKESEAMRQAGHRLARMHYSPDALIGHLDARLHAPDQPTAANPFQAEIQTVQLWSFQASEAIPLFAPPSPPPGSTPAKAPPPPKPEPMPTNVPPRHTPPPPTPEPMSDSPPSPTQTPPAPAPAQEPPMATPTQPDPEPVPAHTPAQPEPTPVDLTNIQGLFSDLEDPDLPERQLTDLIQHMQHLSFFRLASTKSARLAKLRARFAPHGIRRVFLSHYLAEVDLVSPGIERHHLGKDFFQNTDLAHTKALLDGAMLIINNSDFLDVTTLLRYLELYLACDNTVFVVWDFDNHHRLKVSKLCAAHSDLYVPAHPDNLYMLSRYNSTLGAPVPGATVQWSQKFLADHLPYMIQAERSSDPLGKHFFTDAFKYRNQVVNTLGDHYTSIGFSEWGFHGRSREDRLKEWTTHKAHWIVPVLNDIPIRIFDALVTGGIPIVPESLRFQPPVDTIARHHIVFYGPDDILHPHPLVARANALFDEGGRAQLVQRHLFALNHHLANSRIQKILEYAHETLQISPPPPPPDRPPPAEA